MELKVINIFCTVDDFCKQFDADLAGLLLSEGKPAPTRVPGLCMSEMMTIVIYFHQLGFRNFKHYYTDYVAVHMASDFPCLVSYTRFVALMGRMLVHLVAFQLYAMKAEHTGIYFIDSTTLAVCVNQRITSHKVFEGLAERGKTSMGWFFGFKLHLVVNDKGEIVSWLLTKGNVADNNLEICKKLALGLTGLIVGDKGYISSKVFEALFSQGLKLVTRIKRNMKNKLVLPKEKLLLRKRGIIETINDQLKNISQIEHTRHRSPINFVVNLAAGLIAYSFQEKKPSLIRNVDNDQALGMQLIQN